MADTARCTVWRKTFPPDGGPWFSVRCVLPDDGHEAHEFAAAPLCDCCPTPVAAVHLDVWAHGDGRGEPCCGGAHCGVALNAKDGTSNFSTRSLMEDNTNG